MASKHAADNTPAKAELRIVLLGNTRVGKSATANAILEREAFQETETIECEVQRGTVDGRIISVIDTPGINNICLMKDDEELQRCLALSSPGPHMFLLVIRVGRFPEDKRNTIEWIRENLGEEALRFTMVLFTGKEDMTNKQWEIFSEEKHIQEFVSQCGGEYDVINSKREASSSQIRKLLKNLEKNVQQNEGKFYTEEMYQEVQSKIREEREKEVCDLVIVLLGKSGSGKSATGNTILSRKAFEECSSSMCVTIKSQTECLGKSFWVIDTPAINHPSLSSEELKTEMKNCILSSFHGSYVFLLVINSAVIFTEKDLNIIKWTEENFGEEALLNTIILFTCSVDQIGERTMGDFMKDSPELKQLAERCGNRFYTLNNKDPSHSQVTVLMEKINKMFGGNGGQCYTSITYQEALRKKRKLEEEMKQEEEQRWRRLEQRRQKEQEDRRRYEEEESRRQKERKMQEWENKRGKIEENMREERRRQEWRKKKIEENMRERKKQDDWFTIRNVALVAFSALAVLNFIKP